MPLNRFKNLSQLNRTILKSGSWILMGTVVSKVLLLVGTVLIAKYVDKTVYGEFGIIKSTVNMFTVFAGLGLGLTATKFIAQYKNTDKEKVSRILGLSNFFSLFVSLLVLFFFFFFSDALSRQINAPHLNTTLRLSAFILFFSALNGLQNGILAGFEEFRKISINSIIASVLSVIMQVIGAEYFGLKGIVVGFGFNFIILYFLNGYYIYKISKNGFYFRILNINNFKELPIIWYFSIPAVLSGLMVSPVIWITNNFLVVQYKGYEQMATFDIANQWRTTILFIPVALSQIALPMLSSAKQDVYFAILMKNVGLNLIISVLMVIPMIIFTPFILRFYGNQYQDGYFPMVIMMITTVLVAVNNVVGQAIASKNKMWVGFLFNMLWGSSLILSSYFLVLKFKYGVLGLCYSYLISYVFHTFIQFTYFNYNFKDKS